MSLFKMFKGKDKDKGKDESHTNGLSNEPFGLDRSIDHQKYSKLQDIPQFKDIPRDQQHSIFIQKMRACQIMFIWKTNENENENDDPQAEQKELKLQHLVDLLDYVNQNPKGVFTQDTYPEVMEFVSVNFFRQTYANPIPDYVEYDPEEDEPLLEPSWQHLQLVMEFFLRFIVSSDVDPKLSKNIISQSFISRFLALFDSEDSRERDFAKTILHRLYGKFMQHRPFIRKSINDLFYQFIFYSQKHNGIAELLEILGAIINGFAVPLKEEHKIFLQKVLIPLHRPKQISFYHSQLTYCVTQFCEKDSSLAPSVILGLLKYWPQTNPPKVVLFLNELEEVMETTEPEDLQTLLVPIFSLFNKSILSSFQVAERTLFIWENEYILSFINENYKLILPLVFESLSTCAKGHWNANVHSASLKVVKIFSDLDSSLFLECAKQFKEKSEREQKLREARELEWKKIEDQVNEFHNKNISLIPNSSTDNNNVNNVNSVNVNNININVNDEITAASIAAASWTPPLLRQLSLLDIKRIEGLTDPERISIMTHSPFVVPPKISKNNPMYSRSRYGRL